ncbi:MAG: helix-turn-helix transcriptional regulator [Lachnospiraceae bacterium]|nr:helix-turn-helix transcriptional regulator [Lachnospiraceae bacterium]
MAIGERIRFFRNLRGMTQKYLGLLVGFPDKTADIRMAQYEAGTRTPKEDLTKTLAGALGVSERALAVPNIEDEYGVMHTLFVLEDLYGLTIEQQGSGTVFRVDATKTPEAAKLAKHVALWGDFSAKYRAGSISRDEYNHWRYNYPESDDSQIQAKIPSQEFSDAMIKAILKKRK